MNENAMEMNTVHQDLGDLSFQDLPSKNLNLHSDEICKAMSATIGKYINQTSEEAPKCRKKFNF